MPAHLFWKFFSFSFHIIALIFVSAITPRSSINVQTSKSNHSRSKNKKQAHAGYSRLYDDEEMDKLEKVQNEMVEQFKNVTGVKVSNWVHKEEYNIARLQKLRDH